MSGISHSVMIPCHPKTRDRLRDLKNLRGITYEELLSEFLTLCGSPSSAHQDNFVEVRVGPSWGDK